jgi:hypothetical protein
MADPIYPSHLLPLAERIERTVQNMETTIRNRTTSGRSIVRVQYDSVPANVAVRWIFKNQQQCVLFESWFRGVLNNGERWFEMPIELPAGRGPWRVQFASMYEGPRRLSLHMWEIGATLTIYERPIIGGDWAEFYPEAILEADIIDYAVNQQWPKSEYQIDMVVFDRAVNEEWPRS